MYLWGSVSIYSLTNPGSALADGCAPSSEHICLHEPVRYAHKLPRQYQPAAFALIRRRPRFVCLKPVLPAAKIQITPCPPSRVNRDLSRTVCICCEAIKFYRMPRFMIYLKTYARAHAIRIKSIETYASHS